MNLQQQVPSLELCKRLKELGYPQENLFMLVKYEMWKEPQVWNSDIAKEFSSVCLSGKREYEYAAPTVAELGEMLPVKVIERNRDYEMKTWRDWVNGKLEWFVQYQSEEGEGFFRRQDPSEANARAKMMIYLLENKLITLPLLNSEK